MQANIYAPERQPNESLSEYRARRQAQSKLAYGRQIFSPSKYEPQYLNPVRNARRAAIKAAGGIRQFKRARAATRG